MSETVKNEFGYYQNQKTELKNGLLCRIICIDSKNDDKLPIIALVQTNPAHNDYELSRSFRANGGTLLQGATHQENALLPNENG